MGKQRDTVRSYIKTSDMLMLSRIELNSHAGRWRCGCGAIGRWLPRHPRYPYVMITKRWSEHVKVKHPEYEL